MSFISQLQDGATNLQSFWGGKLDDFQSYWGLKQMSEVPPPDVEEGKVKVDDDAVSTTSSSRGLAGRASAISTSPNRPTFEFPDWNRMRVNLPWDGREVERMWLVGSVGAGAIHTVQTLLDGNPAHAILPAAFTANSGIAVRLSFEVKQLTEELGKMQEYISSLKTLKDGYGEQLKIFTENNTTSINFLKDLQEAIAVLKGSPGFGVVTEETGTKVDLPAALKEIADNLKTFIGDSQGKTLIEINEALSAGREKLAVVTEHLETVEATISERLAKLEEVEANITRQISTLDQSNSTLAEMSNKMATLFSEFAKSSTQATSVSLSEEQLADLNSLLTTAEESNGSFPGNHEVIERLRAAFFEKA